MNPRHTLLAKDILSWVVNARATQIPDTRITEVIAGYLQQMELAIRNNMDLLKLPALHPLQVDEFLILASKK